MRVGIIGAGWIAEKAAITLNGLQERERRTGLFRHKENAAGGQCECYAIASRSLAKAQEFASRWNVPKAYGSYEELIADPDVDLVYVATPHSHHYDVTRQAILAGKPCLVEKAFMANLAQAEAIVKLAHERKVFLAEAIWTRYQPAVGIVRGLIDSGRIGTPRLVLNFVRMFFDADITQIESQCVKSATGMDLTNAISLVLADGMLCNLQSSAACVGDNIGVIAGTDGNLIIDNINNPQKITVNTHDRQFVEDIHVPKQITGYEYQFLVCRQALAEGLLEPREMPHAETLYIMQLMDGLRQKWGVHYPMDDEKY